MNKLNIYFSNELVGFVSYDINNDDFIFEYEELWIKKGFELTPHIKFNNDITSNTIKRFIENLLPEGTGREILSINYHISKNNIFGLIQAIGNETTGALTFNNSSNPIPTSFRKINKSELAQRIRDRKSRPISIWDEKPRLSIAGVQDKLPISIIDGEFGFGEGDLASTHILKFEKDDENIVLNEYISLKLASSAVLSVADAKIINVEDQEVLLVKRFDREIISSENVKRIHIIDACQALDLSVIQKYERTFGSADSVKDYREGTSYQKIFSLVDLCDLPIVAKKNLITWICVNLCLGNSDAHGKNLSFMIDTNKMSLSPFYDIVNIAIYKDKYDNGMAMAIDDAFNYDELGSYDFIEFCKELNINLKAFVKEFKRVSKAVNRSLDNDKFFDLHDKNKSEFLGKYKDDVQQRTEKLVKVIDYCIEYTTS